ncbi:MAG TPA: phosphoribosylformylglycinamidine synthase subunit PurS [Gemmatimonadaceae bacterium]|nr:phosphoribosylformylglycinamidine synthase subunit PurS [Gemmatimonadaceae bacterium]
MTQLTRFRASVRIMPRRGILDPQGTAVAHALHALGFTDVGDVRIGKNIVLDLSAPSASGADDAVRNMCEQLLANPVTEEFEIAGIEPL